MDFNDTPEEAAFRAEARAFLEANLGAWHAQERRPEGADFMKAAKDWQRTKALAGYATLTWPKPYGRALPIIMQVIWNQEEAKFRAPVEPFTIGLGMCIPTVATCGTDEQRLKYIRPAILGEEIWCQLFSEPSAGSDVAGIRTKAVREGDDWVVDGQKVWTTGAHFCDYGIVLTRTDPSVPKHKGLTMFIVNMKAPGVEVRPIHQANGGREFNEVYFTGVRIPDSDRVGEVGDGWRVALVTLMNERLAVGGTSGPDVSEIMGLARSLGALEDPVFRDRLADWYVTSQGYKLTKFRTQTALSRGETPGPENSIGKILTANQLQDLSHAAIEMQEHYGILTDPKRAHLEAAFQRAVMWAPGLRIAGGTDEILKNIIAERVLGLPQDVRVDKDVSFEDLQARR